MVATAQIQLNVKIKLFSERKLFIHWCMCSRRGRYSAWSSFRDPWTQCLQAFLIERSRRSRFRTKSSTCDELSASRTVTCPTAAPCNRKIRSQFCNKSIWETLLQSIILNDIPMCGDHCERVLFLRSIRSTEVPCKCPVGGFNVNLQLKHTKWILFRLQKAIVAHDILNRWLSEGRICFVQLRILKPRNGRRQIFSNYWSSQNGAFQRGRDEFRNFKIELL